MSKLILKSMLILFCCLSWATAKAQNASVSGHFEANEGGRLVIKLDKIGGSIEIEGWERLQVDIQGEGYGRGWGGDCDLSLHGSDHEVSVFTGCTARDRDRRRGQEVTLKIKVPRKFDIRLEADAETTISHVEGRMDINIGNADLDLSWVYGRVNISTANGKIYIRDCKLDGDISNVNGRLTVEKSSVQGDVRTTNSSMEISHAPYGIDLGSTNGTIKIGSAKGLVRGRTTNGSVRIAELNGRLDVETVNGHVEAMIAGKTEKGEHSIDIETLNGDVELTLPEDFSMDVDVEVTERNENKRRRRYTIKSDFDILIDEVEYGRDDYEVTGRGKVRGGSNRVRIRAVNGDVLLRKAG